MNKFWNELNKGIHFQDSDILLHWNVPIRTLKSIGNPNVVENGGRVEIKWLDKSLLDGIRGTWSTSYFPYEIIKSFKAISLFYAGDKQSFEAYGKIKNHLLDKLGDPIKQIEKEDEKEIKWENKNCYVHLYLFEMHAFRCSLTIGVN